MEDKEIDGLLIQHYENAIPKGTKRFNAKAYEIGQLLIPFSKENKILSVSQKFEIVGIKDEETLILDTISFSTTGRDRTKKGIEFNIKENIDFVSIYKLEENLFCVRDKIIFNRRIADSNNPNVTLARAGYIGKIIKISEDGNIIVKISKKRTDGLTGKIVKIKSDFLIDGDCKIINFNCSEYPFFQHFS